MRKEDITNNFIHLTNVAIQKTAANYDSKTGGKWSIRNLKVFLQSRHGEERVEELFNNIRMLIIRSLLAVQPVIIHDKVRAAQGRGGTPPPPPPPPRAAAGTHARAPGARPPPPSTASSCTGTTS